MTAPGPTQRVFIGCVPPPALAQSLAELTRPLAGLALRVYPAEDLHLTLVFLGSLAAARVGELEPLLRLAAACAPLELEVESCGVFPERGSPHIFWAGLRDEGGELGHLRQRTQGVLQRQGFTPPAEHGAWTPHLTLARARPPARVQAPAQFLDQRPALRWRADELRLFESRPELGPGRRYAVLARVPLRGAAPRAGG